MTLNSIPKLGLPQGLIVFGGKSTKTVFCGSGNFNAFQVESVIVLENYPQRANDS